MSRILSKDFVYVSAAATDITRRFSKLYPGWNKKPKKAKPVASNVKPLIRVKAA
jgi:hypothetical protein